MKGIINMWHYHYSTIDSELKSRIKLHIETRDWKGNRGYKTHNYFINGNNCFFYNIHPDGKISGNVYIKYPVHNDPKLAVESSKRPKSRGKKVVISKCGETDSEKFDYIAKLILQVL